MRPESEIEKNKSKRKSPSIAALLSLIIPGLGQVYAGDLFRGFALIAALELGFCLMALIIGFITFPAIWIFGVVDAYKSVKNITMKLIRIHELLINLTTDANILYFV